MNAALVLDTAPATFARFFAKAESFNAWWQALIDGSPPSPDQPLEVRFIMPPSLKNKAADLERLVKERAEIVKSVLRDYRETARAAAAESKGSTRPRDRARLNRKRRIVERANAEYIQLQKELDNLRSRMQARK